MFWWTQNNCLLLLSPEPYEVVLEQNGEHMLQLSQSFWTFHCPHIAAQAWGLLVYQSHLSQLHEGEVDEPAERGKTIMSSAVDHVKNIWFDALCWNMKFSFIFVCDFKSSFIIWNIWFTWCTVIYLVHTQFFWRFTSPKKLCGIFTTRKFSLVLAIETKTSTFIHIGTKTYSFFWYREMRTIIRIE